MIHNMIRYTLLAAVIASGIYDSTPIRAAATNHSRTSEASIQDKLQSLHKRFSELNFADCKELKNMSFSLEAGILTIGYDSRHPALGPLRASQTIRIEEGISTAVLEKWLEDYVVGGKVTVVIPVSSATASSSTASSSSSSSSSGSSAGERDAGVQEKFEKLYAEFEKIEFSEFTKRETMSFTLEAGILTIGYDSCHPALGPVRASHTIRIEEGISKAALEKWLEDYVVGYKVTITVI